MQFCEMLQVGFDGPVLPWSYYQAINFLWNRDIVTNNQELVTIVYTSVTFHSPNFFSKWKKQMF